VSIEITVENDPQQRSRACELILRALPGWFGIESANAAYIREVAALPTFVARDRDEPVGFLSLRVHTHWSAEVYVMGVLPQLHGQGIGSRLLHEAERLLAEGGAEYLQVKTLGPSHPSERYARTRRFYEARGFRPLEELEGLWSEGNPCLVLVKRILA
jgi:ribosomal protein S18 acetylase RimI-like enzyme